MPVGSSLQIPVLLSWYSPGCGLLCAAEPVYAGPAVAHPMPSTPAPLPAIPAAFVSHRPDKLLPQSWGSCLLPWPSQLDASTCLCLASPRAGLGWARLGWAELGSLLDCHAAGKLLISICQTQRRHEAVPAIYCTDARQMARLLVICISVFRLHPKIVGYCHWQAHILHVLLAPVRSRRCRLTDFISCTVLGTLVGDVKVANPEKMQAQVLTSERSAGEAQPAC